MLAIEIDQGHDPPSLLSGHPPGKDQSIHSAVLALSAFSNILIDANAVNEGAVPNSYPTRVYISTGIVSRGRGSVALVHEQGFAFSGTRKAWVVRFKTPYVDCCKGLAWIAQNDHVGQKCYRIKNIGREDERMPPNLTAAQVRALVKESRKSNFRNISRFAGGSYENVADWLLA